MFKDENDHVSWQEGNQRLFNAFWPTTSIVLNTCLYDTYSKMGQLQAQWIHILKVSKMNLQYKGWCYQGRNSPTITDLFTKINDYSLQREGYIDQRTQTVSLFTFHIKKEGNKGKINVHSRSRLKKKTSDFPAHRFTAISIPRPSYAFFFFFFGLGFLSSLEYKE